jgi:hypothetical protein
MPAGAPKENTNAEKWTLEQAEKVFDEAINLSRSANRDYDFIGEIAYELNLYKEVFTYLSGKFPQLKKKHNILLSNCEANCFYNGKQENIAPSLAIMNLKSNYKWTDRVDNTTQGEKITLRDVE